MKPVEPEDNLELSEGIGEVLQDQVPVVKEDSLEYSMEMPQAAPSPPSVPSPPLVPSPQLVSDPSLIQDPASPLTSLNSEINQNETLLIGISVSLTGLHTYLTEELNRLSTLREYMSEEFAKLHGRVVHIESTIAKLQSLVKPHPLPAQPISIVPPAIAAATTANRSSPLPSSK